MHHIPRLYLAQPLVVGKHYLLPSQVTQHIMRVLKMRPNDKLMLFNGQSLGEYQAQITCLEKEHAQVLVTSFESNNKSEPTLFIHLGQVLIRGKRMDYICQKSVELGVSKITPLFSDYCQIPLQTASSAKRLTHWQNIIINACEQCGRTRIPLINKPMKLGHWLDRFSSEYEDYSQDLRFMLTPHAENNLLHYVKPTHDSTIKKIFILIGPEGGFSLNELKQGQLAGFKLIKLGPRILRTETASIAVLSALQILLGDFFNGY